MYLQQEVVWIKEMLQNFLAHDSIKSPRREGKWMFQITHCATKTY